ncbi:hypothetical protein B0E45_14960 [Sinorhizobium sp. A49]|nr:hypothetical protein B0E45_14960 [Sinorhizobium sp. A49]
MVWKKTRLDVQRRMIVKELRQDCPAYDHYERKSRKTSWSIRGYTTVSYSAFTDAEPILSMFKRARE